MSQAADDLFHGAGGSARAAAVKKRSVSGQAHSGCMTVMSFAPQQGQPSMVYGNSSALWIGQHHVSLTVFQHRKALQNVGEDRHESHAVGNLVDWGCKEAKGIASTGICFAAAAAKAASSRACSMGRTMSWR